MTNYPNSQDNIITLPGVSGISDEDIAINALRDATFAIEKELGITPSGVYSDVRARFDILEARINNPVSPTILSDGYVNSPLFIVNTPQSVTLSISDGYGFPTENRVNGSLYMRSDGYANNDLYIRRAGVWSPIQTDPFVASGDLSGTYLSQTVIGIRGKSLNSSLASVGATQDGYHLTWSNSDGYWRAETGFLANGDLAPAAGSGPTHGTNTGRTAQTVIKIQGNAVTSGVPTDGYVMTYQSTGSSWGFQPLAVMFAGFNSSGDGYTTRTNIRSNKISQSPSALTGRVGMVNFGTRSNGSSTGTTANYAAILSGDRHSVSGTYGLVVGGDSHTVSNQYGVVVDGYTNTASGLYSAVLNGTNNIASLTQSCILDGYSNTASGDNSTILNGGNNIAGALFSTVINGVSNNVTSGATHSAIMGGLANLINSGSTFSYILNGNNNNTLGVNGVILNGVSSSIATSNFALIGNGSVNTINSTSNFGTILNGSVNTVSSLSTSATIINGNNISVTGNYATVVNANAAGVSGIHSTVVNGNNANITGTYSTILNGLNNTISGNPGFSFILDGYSQNITGVSSWIGDGYSHTIAGHYASILNGNTNSVDGYYNSVINGSGNTINAGITNSIVLNGISNTLANSSRSLVLGNSNSLTANAVFAFGNNNAISSANSFANGNLNSLFAANTLVHGNANTLGSTFSIIGGSNNNIIGNLGYNYVFGQNNNTVSTSGFNLISGFNNEVDGYYSGAIGQGHFSTVDGYNSFVHGKNARARVPGQYSHAAGSFNGNVPGEAQYSRVILMGAGAAGSTFQALIPGDGYLTFEDGKAYDFCIRVLLVNNQPSLVDPTKPARFIYDVLASQENGVLTIHDVNNTLINQNGTGWTVSLSAVNNQLRVTVDAATFPQSPIPFNTSNRRVIVTVEWRTITRL